VPLIGGAGREVRLKEGLEFVFEHADIALPSVMLKALKWVNLHVDAKSHG